MWKGVIRGSGIELTISKNSMIPLFLLLLYKGRLRLVVTLVAAAERSTGEALVLANVLPALIVLGVGIRASAFAAAAGVDALDGTALLLADGLAVVEITGSGLAYSAGEGGSHRQKSRDGEGKNGWEVHIE